MRGSIVHLAWVFAGFCFSLGSSPAIAQADMAATEAEKIYLLSIINCNSAASNANNWWLLHPQITPLPQQWQRVN